MAEREALEREIEELQNLIMDHKRLHGDGPSSTAHLFSSRFSHGRGSNLCYIQSYSGLHQPHTAHPTSYWRKTYSLNNKTTGAHGKSDSRFPNSNLSKIQQARPIASGQWGGGRKLTGISKALAEAQSCKDSAAPSHNASVNVSSLEGNKPAISSGIRTVLKTTRTKRDIELAKSGASRQLGIERNIKLHEASQSASDMVSCTDTFSVSTSEVTSAFSKRETLAQPCMKSHVDSSNLTNRTVIMATNDSSAQPLAPLACPSAASNLRPKPGLAAQVSTACSSHKRSRFIWVKCEGAGTSQPNPAIRPAVRSPSSASASAAPTGINIKQLVGSNKKPHRRPGLSPGAPKTSAYSWVSSSCSTATSVAKAASQAKLPHKSPKALKVPCRVGKEGPEGGKKLAFASPMTPKRAKPGGGSPATQVSHSSRYRWKAAGQSSSVGVCESTPRFSRKASVYRWTAQKQERDSSPGLLPSGVQNSLSTAPPSAGVVKHRSRTTIIRKCSFGLPPERRSSVGVVTVRSRYSLRRRTHAPVKSPTSGRRGQARALVSYGRHKLRLPPSTPAPAAWSPRAGSFSLSGRSSAYLRVIKTRYKIDARRAHVQHHSPALSYRLKRIQSARILLQSRMRTQPDREWRGRSMRWIGGALYRVSANKLSRTHTTSTPSYRSAQWIGTQEPSPPYSVGKTSSTRHVASRVVQRSLAIIRHARQRKQQARHYCMYYNRFGRCNRGNSCPYIHDPEKVAVCTRFLRGTCKQTDGTCPFSHKVSKEKMPVCSYYLKGICSNSSCPYSHVYVSRKAAVCQDFIRGYCPQGEKCKKKHTLVCPEFSSTGVCPRGSQCKLQHRQRGKRPGSNPSACPAKRGRTKDLAKRTEAGSADDTLSSGPSRLPSFISLSCSPDPPEGPPEGPSCSPGARQEATGKKLHIKPRFSSLT